MFFWRRVAPQSPDEHLKPTATPGYARNFREINRQLAEGKSFSGYESNSLFLNLQGSGFADVAGLCGVDFLDDARAVATTDWDLDGRLDLWITNRTAPRLRLLRNNHPIPHAFLELQLIGDGQSTNRDAVGARVTITSSGEPNTPQSQSIRAGDGFLSQSSRLLHFGFGDHTAPVRVEIAWPGGATEVFDGVAVNHRYEIAQGHGIKTVPPQNATPLLTTNHPPTHDQHEPATPGFWVANRVSFPVLTYSDAQGITRSTQDHAGQPVLVNLWATWCAPCVKELQMLAKQEDSLKSLGATVLALNVDDIALRDPATAEDTSAATAAAEPIDPWGVLSKLGFTMPHGIASRDSVAKLEVLIEYLSNRRGTMPIPSSFLVDAQGNIAAVYFGVVPWEQLQQDLVMVAAPQDTQLARLTPRRGRWLADPRRANRDAALSDLATLYLQNGLADQADRLHAMIAPERDQVGARNLFNQAKAAAQHGQRDKAKQLYAAALKIDPEYGEALTGLGVVLLSERRVEDAKRLFQRALQIDPQHATAQVNLAMIDRAQGRPEQAVTRLREVLANNPDFAEAHLNLGSMLAANKQFPEAIEHLAKAVALSPQNPAAHLNLAAAYGDTEQWELAQQHYLQVQKLNPRLGFAHFSLGLLQAKRQQHAAAVASFRQAITLGDENARIYTELGRSLAATGEVAAAKGAFERALQFDANYAAAREALGQLTTSPANSAPVPAK
jgi:tetratricopeptide (TPR) repeat protein